MINYITDGYGWTYGYKMNELELPGQPNLVMLVGAPGTGKSTLINQMFSDDRWTIVGCDKYIEEWSAEIGKTYDECWADMVKDAEHAMMSEVYSAIALEKNIVWDQTNLTKKGRARKLRHFAERDYYKQAIVTQCKATTALDRLRNRKGKSLNEHVFYRMVQSEQPVTIDEGFDKIWVFDSDGTSSATGQSLLYLKELAPI